MPEAARHPFHSRWAGGQRPIIWVFWQFPPVQAEAFAASRHALASETDRGYAETIVGLMTFCTEARYRLSHEKLRESGT